MAYYCALRIGAPAANLAACASAARDLARRRPARAVIALALTLALGACGPRAPTDRAPPASAAERVVNVYNWADYIGPDTVSGFEAATGIKVVYDTFDSEETLDGKLLAGDSGYDVVSASGDIIEPGIQIGEFSPLDRKQLPNWRHLDPHALAVLAHFDPGNRFAVPYVHAINGFAYNVDMVRARMRDAPVDSLDLIFKPEVIARFADCGVTFLDSPIAVMQLALNYLRLDPNSTRAEDYEAAVRLLLSVRPSIRAFETSTNTTELANGELCVAMSWSSDYSVSMDRARAVGVARKLAFTIPREGASIDYDALLIPAGAPHPKAAHRFLDYMLEPKVIAAVTNAIHYGNNNRDADAFVAPWILADPALYPPPELEAHLYYSLPPSAALRRLRTRAWTRIKTGY
jgi:putrescine transport system substrate-binding protein